MFDFLSDKIANAMKNIKGMGKITEDNISDAIREIRMALLQADVNFEVVKEFTENVKTKALGLDVSKNVKPDELFIKLVRDELVSLFGEDTNDLIINNGRTITMFVGLQGSGKTTTCGKIANYVRKNNKKKPLLVACDIYRPAAIEQLEVVAKSLGVDFYKKDSKNVNEIINGALNFASENNNDYIIIDTAGRLQIDEKLMEELVGIQKEFKVDETLLVIDAMIGQDAINVINGFNEKLNLTGSILTKMDSNTKGGVALCVKHLTHLPIKFIGDSEKLDGLTKFDGPRMADRILDMGDILSIASKVEDVISESDAKNNVMKMKSGKYDLNDFMDNLRQIKKLGPLENLLKMLPGARKMGLNNISINPKDLAHIEAMISSMTPYERKHPNTLKASHKIRIAKGSGTSVEMVNRLLKQFEEMKKMMSQFTGKIGM